MNHNFVEDLLMKFGISKMYKGYDYIVSCIHFISDNEYSFTPITKILYVEIAKQYNTSSQCVEKSIRDTIKTIWDKNYDNKLLYEVFGIHTISKRPSNMEFLLSLYQYVKNKRRKESFLIKNNFNFVCPLSGKECEFCYNFISDAISGLSE